MAGKGNVRGVSRQLAVHRVQGRGLFCRISVGYSAKPGSALTPQVLLIWGVLGRFILRPYWKSCSAEGCRLNFS